MNGELAEYFVADFVIAMTSITLYLILIRPKSRLDKFSQDLFRIRDDLFDAMIRGDHDFSDPAYGATRRFINGLIRLAPWMSLFSIYTMNFIVKRCPVTNMVTPNTNDLKLRELLKQSEDIVIRRLVKYVYLETIIGWILLLTKSLMDGTINVVKYANKTIKESPQIISMVLEASEFGGQSGDKYRRLVTT